MTLSSPDGNIKRQSCAKCFDYTNIHYWSFEIEPISVQMAFPLQTILVYSKCSDQITEVNVCLLWAIMIVNVCLLWAIMIVNVCLLWAIMMVNVCLLWAIMMVNVCLLWAIMMVNVFTTIMLKVRGLFVLSSNCLFLSI